MNVDYGLYVIAAALLAVGVWLLLPPHSHRARVFGAVLGLAGLGMLAAQLPALNVWVDRNVFRVLAAVTIVSAVATITCRSPVYCAIWFALTLLASGALLFIQGAQFLGVATVAVYAGAILVTFLFVLMLAQPEGHAYYDRVTWEGNLAALAGAVLVGVLTMTMASVFTGVDAEALASELSTTSTTALALAEEDSAADAAVATDGETVLAQADDDAAAENPPPELDPRLQELRQGVLHGDHVARLGGQLFSRYLLAVEIAGTLLLVALVGAVAIVIHGRGSLRQQPAADPFAPGRPQP